MTTTTDLRPGDVVATVTPSIRRHALQVAPTFHVVNHGSPEQGATVWRTVAAAPLALLPLHSSGQPRYRVTFTDDTEAEAWGDTPWIARGPARAEHVCWTDDTLCAECGSGQREDEWIEATSHPSYWRGEN